MIRTAKRMTFALLVWCILCLAWANQPITSAQDATPTIVATVLPEIVIRASFELASLGAFYSRIELTPSASEFSSVTLSMVQGANSQTIEVPLADIADIKEGYTDFTYIWTPSPTNTPRLFEDVTFIWAFTQINGTTSRIQHTVNYADPRTVWGKGESSAGNIRIAAPIANFNAAIMAVALEKTYQMMSANTGQTTNLSLAVFSDALPIVPCVTGTNNRRVVYAAEGKVEIPCDTGVIAGVYAMNGYVPTAFKSGSSGEVQMYIAQQLLTTLYAPVWNEAVSIIPDWFKFGLAQYYLPTAKTGYLEISRRELRTNRAFSLAEMQATPTDAASLLVWQAQAYGMVLSISEQIGVPALFALARQLGTGATFDQAYQQAMQQPLSGLIPTWSSWVYSDRADNAYQYNPHLPITPTPSLTFTRTPTYTPFPSWTPTITLTPSVTGELSLTPSNTFTPSPTFTATFTPTLTVTPRPASAIVSPTPGVSAANTAASDNNTNLYLGIVLIAAGVIGLAAVLIFSRPANK